MNIGLLHPRVGRSTFPSDSSLPLHSILGEPREWWSIPLYIWDTIAAIQDPNVSESVSELHKGWLWSIVVNYAQLYSTLAKRIPQTAVFKYRRYHLRRYGPLPYHSTVKPPFCVFRMNRTWLKSYHWNHWCYRTHRTNRTSRTHWTHKFYRSDKLAKHLTTIL